MVSVIIPVYNEKGRLKRAVDVTAARLSELAYPFEILIAEDGSNDGTYELASKMVSENSYIHLLHSDRRQGRGNALSRAIKAAKGDVVCYIDADLATDMGYLSVIINEVISGGYDFAMGSRLMPQSDTKRSPTRSIASKTYNWMVRTFLGSKLFDHQCGFKAFRRDPVIKLLDQVKDGHWFWDTELLVRGQYEGLKMKEIPVRWHASDSTKVELKKDIYDMGLQILRLRNDLRRKNGVN
jgi:glycosyltransferase involved in cell wall biosynthesis